MSGRGNEDLTWVAILIVIALFVLGGIFTVLQSVANFLGAEIAPVGRAMMWTIAVFGITGLIYWFLLDEVMPPYVAAAGAVTVAAGGWLQVLDSMALCSLGGCPVQPTFWKWLFGSQDVPEPVWATWKRTIPDVWYTSVWTQGAILVALAALTVVLWKRSR